MPMLLSFCLPTPIRPQALTPVPWHSAGLAPMGLPGLTGLCNCFCEIAIY